MQPAANAGFLTSIRSASAPTLRGCRWLLLSTSIKQANWFNRAPTRQGAIPSGLSTCVQPQASSRLEFRGEPNFRRPSRVARNRPTSTSIAHGMVSSPFSVRRRSLTGTLCPAKVFKTCLLVSHVHSPTMSIMPNGFTMRCRGSGSCRRRRFCRMAEPRAVFLFRAS